MKFDYKINRIRLFVYALCALLILTIKKLSGPTTIASLETPVNVDIDSNNRARYRHFDSQYIIYPNPDRPSFSHSIDSCRNTKAVVGGVTLDPFFKSREYY